MPDSALEIPERPLWAWLAATGVPFDVSAATLIARHGTSVPGPSPDAVCRIPNTGLVRHQLHDLSFDAERLRGPAAPPTDLWASVYDGADGHATFDAAVADLARHFGPPSSGADGAESNTNVFSRIWTFGLATVSLTFWPADLNQSFSTFAYPDPLRWKASSLRIVPAVMDLMSSAEAAALAGATRIASAASIRVPAPGPYANAAYWRRRPAGIADGVAVSRDGRTVFVISERVLVIPRDAVTRLTLHNLTPARGGGGASLRLVLAAGGGASLLDGDAPFTLDAEAERLSELLGVPLEASTWPDI